MLSGELRGPGLQFCWKVILSTWDTVLHHHLATFFVTSYQPWIVYHQNGYLLFFSGMWCSMIKCCHNRSHPSLHMRPPSYQVIGLSLSPFIRLQLHPGHRWAKGHPSRFEVLHSLEPKRPNRDLKMASLYYHQNTHGVLIRNMMNIHLWTVKCQGNPI